MTIDLTEEEREFLEKFCKRLLVVSANHMENKEFFDTPLQWAKEMGKLGFLLEKLQGAK